MLGTDLRSTFSKSWPGNMFMYKVLVSCVSPLSPRQSHSSKLPAFQEKQQSKIADSNPRMLK